MNQDLINHYPYNSIQNDSDLLGNELHFNCKSKLWLVNGECLSTLRIPALCKTIASSMIASAGQYIIKNNQTLFFLNPKITYDTDIRFTKQAFYKV
jgi:hypothetical protein